MKKEKMYEDDHVVLDVLESESLTRRKKNRNQISPLLLEL